MDPSRPSTLEKERHVEDIVAKTCPSGTSTDTGTDEDAELRGRMVFGRRFQASYAFAMSMSGRNK